MSKNIKDELSLGEKLYCVLQDLKNYNHNLLNEEIDWIIDQLENIKSIYDEANFKTPREIELEARVKELEEKLNVQFAEMEEKLTAEEMKNFELNEKLKIAEESLQKNKEENQ